MVTQNLPQTESEPTEEFSARCMAVLREWHSGRLPFQEAIARLNIYRSEAIASGHLANQGRAEQLLGNVQHYHGNLTTSVQHWERARKLFGQVNNQIRVAAMDLNIGESYRFKGDYTRALRLYRTAYNIAEERDDGRLQVIAIANQGLVLSRMGQNTAAYNAFQEALKLSKEKWPEDDPEELTGLLCEIHHGIATIHLEAGDPHAAWDEAVQALELTGDGTRPMERGYAHRIAGQVISQLGKSPDPRWPNDPDEYFRIALQEFRTINAEAELARTMFVQALSLAARGRPTMAARKLQQVIIIFSRLGMIDDAARAAEAQLSVT